MNKILLTNIISIIKIVLRKVYNLPLTKRRCFIPFISIKANAKIINFNIWKKIIKF